MLRLLFVVLVAAGIAGMHTLGHPSSGGHGGPAHSEASTRLQSPASHLTGQIVTVAATTSDVVPRGVDMGLDPSTVCMAILVAYGLAALAALVISGRLPPASIRDRRSGLIPAGRDPPPYAAIGLRLADLSVLRR